MSKAENEKNSPPAPPAPVDMDGGLPDRAARRPYWKYVIIVLVFLAWVAALVWIQQTGNVPGPR